MGTLCSLQNLIVLENNKENDHPTLNSMVCHIYIDLPLVMFSCDSSALFNEVVVCQSEEVDKGCSAHTSL